jgi:hypothetical protein
VLHGGQLVCLAFDFQPVPAHDGEHCGVGATAVAAGKRAPRFTYISDVSSIPDAVLDKLRSGPQIEVCAKKIEVL